MDLTNDGTEFDAEQHESSFDLIPPGEYQLFLANSSDQPIERDGVKVGTLLKLEFEIAGPTQAGRKLWLNLCWKHPNQQAEKIARERFADLCRATGKLKPRATEELHNLPFRAMIGIEKGKGGYEDRSTIKKFLFDAPDKKSSKGKPAAPAAGKPKMQSAAAVVAPQESAGGDPWDQ